MKFEMFKIGTAELHSVNRIEITKAARNRTVTTNLNGDMLIDQSAIKRNITAHIVLCSAADMAVIEAAVAAGLVEISFYEGAELVTITATCASINKPKPFYLNGDRAQGVYYNDVTLTWEER